MVFAHAEISRIQEAGADTATVLFQTSPRPFVFLRQVKAIRKKIESFRPDVVHAHFGTITGFGTVVASTVPVVITFRGSDLNPSPSDGAVRNFVQKLLSNVAALLADTAVVVSQELRSRLWFRRVRAVVIPTGVDMAVFRPINRAEARGALGWQDRPTVLFNAGLTPAVKRLDVAQSVFELIKQNIPTARLEVLRGKTPHTELPLYLNASDCLLLTSDFEGSPDIIKEAMACNLPIVAFDVGDVRERTDGVAATAIVQRDTDAMARAAIEIIRSGQRSNGRSKIQELDAPRVRDAVLAVYQSSLAQH